MKSECLITARSKFKIHCNTTVYYNTDLNSITTLKVHSLSFQGQFVIVTRTNKFAHFIQNLRQKNWAEKFFFWNILQLTWKNIS